MCDEEQQEEDEAHAGADEEQQQNSGNDGMKAATYKVRGHAVLHLFHISGSSSSSMLSQIRRVLQLQSFQRQKSKLVKDCIYNENDW